MGQHFAHCGQHFLWYGWHFVQWGRHFFPLSIIWWTLSIIWWTLSIIWWTPTHHIMNPCPSYDGPQSHPNENSMNNSAIEWDIEKTISQHSMNSNSLILGLLKTRDIANLSKKGIHHMMYPVHHMMYPVHHMMDPPIHHMMDGVHHMMDGVHHMMDLHYIIYCQVNFIFTRQFSDLRCIWFELVLTSIMLSPN